MQPSYESYFAKAFGGYVIIENVPCYKCEQCGEVVFKASVMEKIEDFLANCSRISKKVTIVDFVDFSIAA